jgi:DNA-binding beta-propeller fold protein YncE
MKRFLIAVILMVTVLSLPGPAADRAGVIKNPKPNMIEKNYVELVKVKELSADIQDEDFIFRPITITLKGENLYVFDDVQAKVFKLDRQLKPIKSYGRVGQGPGELFSKGSVVFISFGLDGKLYLNDANPRKMIILDENLEYENEFKYNMNWRLDYDAVVDADGDVYFLDFDDTENMVKCFDYNKKPLFNFPVDSEDISTLYERKSPTFSPGGDRIMAITRDSVVLVFFRDSSSLFVLKNNKLVKKRRLWPRDALADYKSKLNMVLESNKTVPRKIKAVGFAAFFGWIVTDNDDGSKFYLDYVNNETKGIRALYQFNTDGELLKVLYVKIQKPTLRLLAKGNNQYYGIAGEKIVIYKEKEEK